MRPIDLLIMQDRKTGYITFSVRSGYLGQKHHYVLEPPDQFLIYICYVSCFTDADGQWLTPTAATFQRVKLQLSFSSLPSRLPPVVVVNGCLLW